MDNNNYRTIYYKVCKDCVEIRLRITILLDSWPGTFSVEYLGQDVNGD